MRILLLIALCLIMGVSGCKSAARKGNKKEIPHGKKIKTSAATNAPTAAPTPRPRPGARPAGKIVGVKPELRFVVIDFSNSQLPSIEQRLSVYRLNQKVGEVKVSGPYRGSTVAADIVAGEAQFGDFVKID